MATKAILIHNGSKYEITIRGKKVISGSNKKLMLRRFEKDFLNSKYAIKNRISVVPEIEDLTDDPAISAKGYESIAVPAKTYIDSKFDINEKFEFLESLVNMVLDGTCHAMIVTGEGGLGKTHTVRRVLRDRKMSENSDYMLVSGSITPKGLFRFMQNNSDKTIVFDDCDRAFSDPKSADLLKAALDDKKFRRVAWIKDREDDDLDGEFDFTGKIIFISNIEMEKFSGPIKSRSMMIDLTMTVDDKINRMRKIVREDDFMPEFDLDTKLEALEFMIDKRDIAIDFNMRTLGKVIKIRIGGGKNWQNMAEYMLCNN